jgi:hypothetical protein
MENRHSDWVWPAVIAIELLMPVLASTGQSCEEFRWKFSHIVLTGSDSIYLCSSAGKHWVMLLKHKIQVEVFMCSVDQR